ncbi:hypothetical protein VL14_16740 [Cytobacillus firmus]|nr:hypothetical protein VL14_16740 [Cytobacillus firmus]
MQKVSDIVSLPHLQDGEFSAHVRRAELHRRNTVDDLMTFDSQQTLALDPIEQDLHLIQTYIDEISSLFQSGNLSISGYSVKQIQSSPIYGELLEGIRHKAGNSVRSPEFFKELGVTALGQILPPGAYSIWAIWQSTYERKTIRYQLTALKALAELNSSEITPEEFTSLSGREILTVDVIDEYGIGSENQGGKFHLYEDGRIVREFYGEKGIAYEFVDSIPEDRVGGVRELDSIADGTPLEILEYLSLAAVVRKQGTKVIRKSIKKADFDGLVRILKEEKGHVVLPGKTAGKDIDNAKEITKLTVEDIPTAKSGNFNKFFNSLTSSELDELWKEKKIRKKIERQLREPGGLHEWHLVSRAPQFKYWNIGAEEIKDLRTAISDVRFVNPSGVHGGLGSTKAHNELLAIIDTSSDYNTFVRRLNNWANYRLEGGVSSLPQGLRLK